MLQAVPSLLGLLYFPVLIAWSWPLVAEFLSNVFMPDGSCPGWPFPGWVG
jgi:hypothetical protein